MRISVLKHILLLFYFFIFLSSTSVFSQKEDRIVKEYKKEDFEGKLDSLNELYGKNKELPKGYELQALIALSHYPQLKDIPIKFIVHPAYIPLTSKPALLSIFRKKDKWYYIITISSSSSPNMDNILLKNLSFNAQVGVLGHELAHTVFYLDKDWSDILSLGINYLIPYFRGQFEKDTDRRAVRYGLGWQLYDYSSYVRALPDMKPHTEWVDQYYLSPERIIAYMKKVPGYYIPEDFLSR
ncbi:MAG: hypothetical protein ACK40G_06610 [Cytophagaceae bacterium]